MQYNNYFYPPAVQTSLADYPFLSDLSERGEICKYGHYQHADLILKLHELESKCLALEKENDSLKAELSRQSNSADCVKTEENAEQSESELKEQDDDSESFHIRKPSRGLKKRRTGEDLVKDFPCPYDKCKRSYASSLALNLHMRMKHNGGTKKQRKEILKAVIDAELQGTKLPDIKINLPPNYIQEKKRIILGCQDFSKNRPKLDKQ